MVARAGIDRAGRKDGFQFRTSVQVRDNRRGRAPFEMPRNDRQTARRRSLVGGLRKTPPHDGSRYRKGYGVSPAGRVGGLRKATHRGARHGQREEQAGRRRTRPAGSGRRGGTPGSSSGEASGAEPGREPGRKTGEPPGAPPRGAPGRPPDWRSGGVRGARAPARARRRPAGARRRPTGTRRRSVGRRFGAAGSIAVCLRVVLS
jgi:hypothetical protein